MVGTIIQLAVNFDFASKEPDITQEIITNVVSVHVIQKTSLWDTATNLVSVLAWALHPHRSALNHNSKQPTTS